MSIAGFRIFWVEVSGNTIANGICTTKYLVASAAKNNGRAYQTGFLQPARQLCFKGINAVTNTARMI
jgi:hypothetical protein